MEQIYKSVIEALIFASDDSISSSDIVKAIKGIDGEDVQITYDEIDKCVDELNLRYDENNIPFQIVRFLTVIYSLPGLSMQNISAFYHQKKVKED